MTTNERNKLIELLTRFSQEYCCEECDYASCDTCEFNDRGCCQMINSISEWLNNELTEEQMIRSINWEYNVRKEED